MSGHSKWANIKHRKDRQDKVKGKAFSVAAKAIMSAVRAGGSDPDGSSSLRLAIQKAREVNMPKDRIEYAIQRAAGTLEGTLLESVTYEGYGAGGAAVMLEALTDNKNRTAADVRHIFSKRGGNLGASGCVGWLFKRCGLILLGTDKAEEDQLLEWGIEWGADDVRTSDDGAMFEIECEPARINAVVTGLEEKGIEPESVDFTALPENTVTVSGKAARTLMTMLEELDDLDDIQNVFTNFDMDDAEMAAALADQ